MHPAGKIIIPLAVAGAGSQFVVPAYAPAEEQPYAAAFTAIASPAGYLQTVESTEPPPNFPVGGNDGSLLAGTDLQAAELGLGIASGDISDVATSPGSDLENEGQENAQEAAESVAQPQSAFTPGMFTPAVVSDWEQY